MSSGNRASADSRHHQLQGRLGQDDDRRPSVTVFGTPRIPCSRDRPGPQSSLSALLGYQPETDVGENETFYGACDMMTDDGLCGRWSSIPTSPGLDIVPGNLELQEIEHETPRMLAANDRGQEIFFARIASVIQSVAEAYDVVVIDCPPQLGFLTLGALCAATGVLVTVHPQMLDIASMSQFLLMTGDLLRVVHDAGGRLNLDFLRYLITRHEPQDGPQTQVVGFHAICLANAS